MSEPTATDRLQAFGRAASRTPFDVMPPLFRALGEATQRGREGRRAGWYPAKPKRKPVRRG